MEVEEYRIQALNELKEILEHNPLSKYYFLKKADERRQDSFHPELLFAGDLATSLDLPEVVRQSFKPYLNKWGYDFFEEIIQLYFKENMQFMK